MTLCMLMKFPQISKLLRLQSFDINSDTGRANERDWHIALTSITAAVSKITAASAMLYTVPLTMGYLGTELFGLWMTIYAGISMLTFLDLGISNGVLNAIAHATGKNDNQKIQAIVTNGLFMLCIISITILMLFFASYFYIPWTGFLKFKMTKTALEVGPVMLVLLLCFVSNLPLAAVQKIQMGLQRGYLANFWEILGSVGGVIGIVIAVKFEARLYWIVLAVVGIPVVFRGINTLVFFKFQQVSFQPHLTKINLGVVKTLVRAGSLFFILQLAFLVGFQSDNIIIAKILGVDIVSGYDVILKIASLPGMFIGFFVAAQWPAYGEAYTRGDTNWIVKTFSRTLRLSILINLPFALFLVLWGDQLIKLWVGPKLIPSLDLLVGMALWSQLQVIGNVISALLNGLHIVRFQVICASLMAVGNILLSIYLVGRIGVAGAIYGTLVAYTIFTLIPCWYYVPCYLKRLTSNKM
jgi:O-antigen/teichoic acid export membrane protein